MNLINKYDIKLLQSFFAVFLIFICPLHLVAENVEELPKTEILGQEYYIYEIGKGESLYGISKKFGWDTDNLIQLNPETARSLKKGDKLYYPVNPVNDKPVQMRKPEANGKTGDFVMEPIRHKVRKGETVYSISRQYGIPVEKIYASNPSSQHGVKVGETLELPQSSNAKYYYYTVKSGDTLTAISQSFDTTVEDIFKENVGLNGSQLTAGETLRIKPGSNFRKTDIRYVEEEYPMQNNVADEDSNLSEEIAMPVTENITEELEETPEYAPEENSETYDSVSDLQSESRILDEIRVALILDDPVSKKDIDFTRGILIGLSQMVNEPYRVDLKIIDGRVATNSLLDTLDIYEPSLVLATADKAFPLFLADYGNSNNVQIVNVFDTRNDLYEDNASMVQLLPPSQFFYEHIARRIYRDNRHRKLVLVGEPDETDNMVTEIVNNFGTEPETMSLEELSIFQPDIMDSILIYAYPSKKEEVADFMLAMSNLKENYPGADIKIIGRMSWAALMDEFGDRFREEEVIIPSRVWLDENSERWNEFCDKYEEMFAGNPVRSFPNFAANGYDVIRYFVPAIHFNGGDFNSGFGNVKYVPLQQDIEPVRANERGGFMNTTGYLLRFNPSGEIEKIIVK